MQRSIFEPEHDQFRESARRFFQTEIGPNGERWRQQGFVENGKGGRDRIVPMSTPLRTLLTDLALLERLGPNDHIFYAVQANQRSRKITRSKPVGEGTFARWWAACLDRANVRYRSPHTARHTFATSWRRRGYAVDELKEMLGHASISTTSDLYVHTGYTDLARRMAEIEARESLSPEHAS
jgi:integrase